MRRTLPPDLASEWGPDFTRGVGVSALLHVALATLVVWMVSRTPAPPPLTSYTVELTDPAALGGRLAFGPLDRPLGRPRRLGDAAGGAVAGPPSPGEAAPAKTVQPPKAAESRAPVAPARVAEAPKPAAASAKDPDAPVVPPKPVAPPVQPKPPVPAPPAATPAPRPPEVRLAEKPKPEEPKPEEPKTIAPRAPADVARAEPQPRPQPRAEPKPVPPAAVPVAPQAKAAVSTTAPPSTTVPTATTLPEPKAAPERPDVRDAPEVRPHSPGAVTAHPVPAAPKPAPPVPETAPRNKPAGAADGVRIVPADPVSPAPAPGAGTAAKPAPDRQASGGGGTGSGGSVETPQEDEYAAAAERWRSRMSGGMGGMGGAQSDQGTIGDGTTATGGGGGVVGFEFLSYRQRIFGLIKSNWANAARRDGLVAAVRFDLDPNGTISGVTLVRSSGDRTYDQSVVRAVQRSSPLPPPPERYRDDFREVVIDFYSEEQGGQGTG